MNMIVTDTVEQDIEKLTRWNAAGNRVCRSADLAPVQHAATVAPEYDK
jgi:hypothetical protein